MADVLGALRGIGSPTLAVAGRSGFSEEEIEAAAGGTFRIYTSMVELSPPVDWNLDPHGNRSFRFQLHSLQFLGVLIRRYEQLGDVDALGRAVELALDWIGANELGADGVSELAWYDMAVGLRAPYLAFALRAGACEGVLDEEGAERMVASLREHGEFLADAANYAEGHNHGLFQDEGLLVLAACVEAFVPEAERWRQTGTERALATLRSTVDDTDAVHLEHSPGYHFAMTNLVTRLIERGRVDDAALMELRERMIERAGWLVMPNGKLPQVGDTNAVDAPRWSDAAAATARGTIAFRHAGYAVARRTDSYLIMVAGYHSAAHKQADEVSFVLFDRGRVILGDPGIWSYDEDDPYRIYARSSTAHNALLVDGDSFAWRDQPPYGSAIKAVGEQGDWHGMLGSNPLLKACGVEHDRLLLWRPGVALIVVDAVHSGDEHAYTRRFHLGPTIEEAEAWTGDVVLRGEAFSATLRDWSEHRVATEIVRGRETPEPLGWVFPEDQQRTPVYCVSFEAHAREATFVTVLTLDEPPLRVAGATFDGAAAQLRTLRGDTASTLRVRRHGEVLVITETGW